MRFVSSCSVLALAVVSWAAGAIAGPINAPAAAGRSALLLTQAPALPPEAVPPRVTAPDGPAPPVTPGIRPHRNDQGPERAPETLPDRKSEPKADPRAPPAPRNAEPTPRSRPAPDPKSAEPKSLDPKNPGPKSKAEGATPAGKAARPGLAVAQPRTAAERDKALSDLYALLATAEDANQSQTVTASIERLWVTSGSDTINLLMGRALQAADAKNPELAIQLLDAVVTLAPDYAEGWNRRAYLHYTQNHIDLALGDLRRTLALDQNHFKALDGLVHILQEIGRKKEALAAARKLLDVDPFYDGAKQIVDELSREIEDRGI